MPRGSVAPQPGQPGVRTGRTAGPGSGPSRIGRLLQGGRSDRDGEPGRLLLRLLMRWVRRPLLPAVRLWRRNIQLRIVVTTLLMSLGVVVLLGFVVIGQVRNGLLDAKGKAAQSQAAGGFAVARDRANALVGPGPTGAGSDGQAATSSWRSDLVEQLASGGQGAFSVVALSVDSPEEGLHLGPRTSGGVHVASIPENLRQAVGQGTGTYETYIKIQYKNDEREPQAGLVVGTQLNDIEGNPYELYYLFPLAQEEQSLNLVRGTLATAGLFVVVLLGAIAWLVVRQIVTPVRMAAGIAERLSAGRLQERMKVTGEDDIARLGEAFNKMAQNLQLKIQQLEELSRMQRRFVSDVSHELRTPLTTVRMAADVIHEARSDFDPVTARSAELLGDQLDRFESLLSDLLEISRFDAGAAALEAEPIDLRQVVRRVIGGAEPLAERKGTRIRVLGDEQPVIAEADARRVERVLRNLVVNAVEHGEGRDVVVRLAVAGGAVAVAVRDYGVGLKPGEATRVFNRFWRADPARARTTGGTGLGLSIAVEDARLHGGWLQAWGEPGGGSQFRLTLPRTADEPLRGSPIPLEPEDSRQNRERAQAAQAATTAPRSNGHLLASLPVQAVSPRSPLSVPPRVPPPPRTAPAGVNPAALPGSGARVVARPAGELQDDDMAEISPNREDTTRGR
ncbi:MtrAB system histidine kinase MtrB [Streptomyces albipurpureus]|uniref:Sensor histidine kinase MtrB n=1 Tax=Streptomyces albipurpureus TaxID=2897419 RepID=A0ABT0UUS6_9ACTN|nr:MtrAB system histidine kinase MtrB [Streptomyces sp. CWNU-1]MCM2392322.1 MtrAB system histidine kinase MtrB [Streptomyces sp. CWNU-1]